MDSQLGGERGKRENARTNGRGNPLWRVVRFIVGLIDIDVEIVVDATRYYGRVRVMPFLLGPPVRRSLKRRNIIASYKA